VQNFTAIFIKYCTKCKSVIKKNTTQLFQFSSLLFDRMKKSYMTDYLCLNVVNDETVGLQARSFTTPSQVRQCPNSIKGGSA